MKLARLKPLVFLLALVPAAMLVWGFLHNQLGANPIERITHETGQWALRFLLLSLAITPARRWLNLPDLIKFRRMLGLFSFFYLCAHFMTWAWLDKLFDPKDMLADVAKRPFITAGMAGFVCMIPLALTSTKGWIRRLGKKWQKLHRLAYACAFFGVLHFYWLVKSDIREPLFYGAIFAVLMLLRIRFTRKQAPMRATAPQT